MKFFIQLHYYMVIGLILAVLGSSNNNFAMKEPSLNTKQQDLCALLPDLNPHGPKEDYDQFAQRMANQKLTTCLCVKANREIKTRKDIEAFHNKIAKITHGAEVITPQEYYQKVTQPVQEILNKTSNPGDPKAMITYKDPFSPQIKKVLEETYKEYKLGFPLEVEISRGQGTAVCTKFDDFGNRIERLRIDFLDFQDENDGLRALFAHEIGGHSKNGHGTLKELHSNLLRQKIQGSTIKLTNLQKTDFNESYSCILKNFEEDADQNPCACSSLSSATNIVTYHKYLLQKHNFPESSSHPSSQNRYNDVLRILRLKKAENILRNNHETLSSSIERALRSKWFT